ncbi:pirin family protein [Paenibacillus sp. y28]|uniref:pirin family protein n=1 Tax=Paenibacillus sp. y28 TaxID=3129110 RepID=UPI00301A7924
MIQVVPAASRYAFDRGWLRGNYSFPFADYQDPEQNGFGPLRVFNDDWIAPGKGFGAHPHADMEIVSVVLKGELRHEDNLGNVAVTGFGEIQRMSAGSGIIHTEHNSSETEELSLLQMWFMPHTRGLTPSYMTSRFDTEALQGRLLPIVSHTAAPQVASIQQDMTLYLSRLSAGEQLTYQPEAGRRTYLFVIEGGLTINGDAALAVRDSARITETPELTLSADGAVFFMLIDLP